ncbi:amidohydrolase [Gottschalkia purinilytica]|uniref:Amidohydrolase n=1 Tax=Gottschalkia purinilytica TaxID=1503 RepID=A0A0L0WEX2_GOTPU|nr:M20 family metallopeptidase [Gottschalkia purinilytica]KNF10032.1 amidohydrolase [Gottschalkia purinilytica]
MNDSIYDKISKLANKYKREVIEIRRSIHMYPELAFEEIRTSQIVANKLKEIGIEVTTKIAETGVVGILRGKYKGKTVALRADMDALPIQEDNELDFKSINDGVMHACGHDCHTANLLGVAMILSELREEIRGNVKFIFQPGEETGGGGNRLIKAGVLENPKVDAIFAIHIGPGDLGRIDIGHGSISANSDGFMLKIKGKKAHTSTPQQGTDAIVISAHIITALQTILTRQLSPFEPATFTIGKIKGGVAHNIIPDLVQIRGMIRCISQDARKTIKDKIKDISKSIAESMGGDCEVKFKAGYPSVINNKKMFELVKKVGTDLYGKERVFINNEPMLISEDFGFYSHLIPACLFFISSGESCPLHTSKFIVDEDVFDTTLTMLSSIAVRYLHENS